MQINQCISAGKSVNEISCMKLIISVEQVGQTWPGTQQGRHQIS